jgi:predicted DNA-binding antitoxin AbrB/MazE fold protein
MSTTIEAIYEHGVLRLTKPISLPEGAIVEVTIVMPDSAQGKARPSEILSTIASLPLEGDGAAFSGQDHDQALYGKEEPS